MTRVIPRQYGSGDNKFITSSERENVVGWRGECLYDAGMRNPELAYPIANDLTIDLHKACEMLKAGCPEELLAKILL